MNLPNSWVPFINKNNTKYKILLTMGVGRLSSLDPYVHPGTIPTVIRASNFIYSHPVSKRGETYPYWPVLQEFPPIKFAYSPEQRSVDEGRVAFRLIKTPELSTFFNGIKKRNQGWVHICLWIDGVPLEDSIPLFAGPITSLNQDFSELTISVAASDTFDGVIPEFPLTYDKLSKNDFPELPDNLDQAAPRRFLLGPLTSLLDCFPISRDGLEYYICEPWMDPPPNEFFIGSSPITNQFPVAIQSMTPSGLPFMKLKLQKRPEAAGFSGAVFCRGGSGPTHENAIDFFIKRIPKIKLTQRARQYVQSLNRYTENDYSVISSSTGAINEILFSRLLPQSNLIPFWRGGRLDMIKENGNTAEHEFVLGGNMLFRTVLQESVTSEDNVRNAIEVKYSRRHLGDGPSFSRNVILVDKNYGGRIGQMLAVSERRYGRRFQEVDAADLYTQLDAERLGVGLAKTLHTTHRRWGYFLTWSQSFFIDINDIGYLTDAALGLARLKVRVSEMECNPNGVSIVLQAQDF